MFLNLRDNLIAWLENEGEITQVEIQCDFIEGGNQHNIAINILEGDALNVILPMTYKNCKHVPSIVEGELGINFISNRLYDASNLPRMNPTAFSINLENKRKVTPLGLVKNIYIRVARI